MIEDVIDGSTNNPVRSNLREKDKTIWKVGDIRFEIPRILLSIDSYPEGYRLRRLETSRNISASARPFAARLYLSMMSRHGLETYDGTEVDRFLKQHMRVGDRWLHWESERQPWSERMTHWLWD